MGEKEREREDLVDAVLRMTYTGKERATNESIRCAPLANQGVFGEVMGVSQIEGVSRTYDIWYSNRRVQGGYEGSASLERLRGGWQHRRL